MAQESLEEEVNEEKDEEVVAEKDVQVVVEEELEEIDLGLAHKNQGPFQSVQV